MHQTQGTKKAKVLGQYTPSSTINFSDFEVGEEKSIGQKMTKKKGKDRNDMHIKNKEIGKIN